MKRPPKPAAWLRLRPAFTPRDGLLALTCPPDPAQRVIKLVAGAAAILFGVVSGYVQQRAAPVPAFFVLVGIASIAMTLLRPEKPHTLRITDKTVIVDGPAAWRAPVKNYVGVALRQRQQDGTTLHVVELEHDDPELTIPLHVSTEAPPPELLEGFAQRFDLPALQPRDHA